MSRLFACFLVTLVVGCGSIERTTAAHQSLGRVLLAGPGDLVLRVERERNLENVVGKADIFGRKTKEGFTEVRFAGVEPSGVVVLFRKDVSILTNETTMSRTPMSTTTGTATTTGSASANTFGNTTQLTGSTTTTGVSTTVGPASAYTLVVPSDSVAIRLGTNERRVPVAGYVIEVLSVTSNSIEYRLSAQ